MNRKRIRLQLILLGLAGIMVFSSSAQAQCHQKPRKGSDKMHCQDLTSQPKSKVKELRVDYLKETKEVRNRLDELKVRQHILVTAENPDLKKIYANIDKITQNQEILMKSWVKKYVAAQDAFADEPAIMKLDRECGQSCNTRERGCREVQCKSSNCKKSNCKGQGGRRDMLQLSDEQKEQMTKLRVDHSKAIKPLKDKMRELKSKQMNMMGSDGPDMKGLMANVEELISIRNKVMKKKVAHRMQVRNLLNEDQRILWNETTKNKKECKKGVTQSCKKGVSQSCMKRCTKS